jgi:hypothetical protein
MTMNKEAYQEVLTELREKLPGHLGDELARHRLEAAASPGKEQAPSPATVHFRDFTCELDWKTYPDGRPALYLVDVNTREIVAAATAYLPYVPLKPGEVFIKDHSENRGMLAALENAGIVQATGETVQSGFVEVPVAKIMSPIHRRDRQDDRENARANENGAEKIPTKQMPGATDFYRQMLAEAAASGSEKSKDKDNGIER